MNQKDVKVSFYLKSNETNDQGAVMSRLTVGRSESVFSAKDARTTLAAVCGIDRKLTLYMACYSFVANMRL